jgi:hypothetical protein
MEIFHYDETTNSKPQIPNKFQFLNFKSRVFGIWKFEFVCDFVLGHWNLYFVEK